MNNMKTLNRILIGTVLLATLFSCQDVVTYNDGCLLYTSDAADEL